MSTIDPRPEQLPQRVAESINRDDLPLIDDRSRLRYLMNNLILHIHPSKVNKASLKFTYTWKLPLASSSSAISTTSSAPSAPITTGTPT